MSEDWAWLQELEKEAEHNYHIDAMLRFDDLTAAKQMKKLISAIHQMKTALELCTDCENGYPERLSHHSKTARETLARLAKAPQEEVK